MENEENKEITLVKEQRVELDIYLKLLDRLTPSRYTSMAKTEIEFGRMWLGKILTIIGDDNPYKELDGNRKSVKDIKPATDKSNIEKAEIEVEKFNKMSQIEAIDYFRESVKKITIDLNKPIYKKNLLVFNATITHLVNGVMALGGRLGEIRDNQSDSRNLKEHPITPKEAFTKKK